MSSPATASKEKQGEQKMEAAVKHSSAATDARQSNTDSPSRPRRKRKIKFPYGEDFITPVKQEAMDDDDDDDDDQEEMIIRRSVVPQAKRAKRKPVAVDLHEEYPDDSVHVLAEEEELEEEYIVQGEVMSSGSVKAGDSDAESGENIATRKKVNTVKSSAEAEELGVDSDDNVCDETFGKPCYESKDPTADLPLSIVLRLLQYGKDKMCVTRFAIPKGGEAFLFDTGIVLDLWEKDGFDWQIAAKERKSEVKEHNIVTSVHVAHHPDDSKMMSRYVYSFADKRHVILVYYKEKDIAEEVNILEKAEHEVDYKTQGFDYKEALDMLSDCEDKLSTQAPTYPKAGEIYFYDTREVGELWKFDKYVWRNCGRRLLPARTPQVTKSFFLIRVSGKDREGSTAFRRYTYQSIIDPHYIMVHYVGDEKVFKPRPHGNAKALTSTYTPSPRRAHSMSKSSASGLRSARMRYRDDLDDSDIEEQEELRTSRTKKKAIEITRTVDMDEDEHESFSDVDCSGISGYTKAIGRKIEKAVPAMVCDGKELLSYDFVVSTLRDFNGPYNTTSPFYPKSGEVFVYNAHRVAVKWKQDGYAWADQRSTSYYPRHKPEVIRRIHCIYNMANKKGSKTFQRCTYCLSDRQHVMLVHYVGDDKAAGRPEDADHMIKVLEYPFRVEGGDAEMDSVEETYDAQVLLRSQEPGTAVLVKQDIVRVTQDDDQQIQQQPQQEQPQQQQQTQQEVTHSEEHVTMRLEVLHQQKKNLQLQETKLVLEIKSLQEEKEQFFAKYGYV